MSRKSGKTVVKQWECTAHKTARVLVTVEGKTEAEALYNFNSGNFVDELEVETIDFERVSGMKRID